jgi:hypothetical protein
VTPERIADLLKKWPGGYFVPSPEHGFDTYLDVCDQLAAEQGQSEPLRKWREAQDLKLGRKPQVVGGAK